MRKSLDGKDGIYAVFGCRDGPNHRLLMRLTTIHYLASKAVGAKQATQAIATLLGLFEVAPVTRAVLDDALGAGFTDFEYAVLYHAARHAGSDGIVTRNKADFVKAALPLYTPAELVGILP